MLLSVNAAAYMLASTARNISTMQPLRAWCCLPQASPLLLSLLQRMCCMLKLLLPGRRQHSILASGFRSCKHITEGNIRVSHHLPTVPASLL